VAEQEERWGAPIAPRGQRRRARCPFLPERGPPARNTSRGHGRRKSRPSGLRPAPSGNDSRRYGRIWANSSRRPVEPPWWRSWTRSSVWDAGLAKKSAPLGRSRLPRPPGWTGRSAPAAGGAWANARGAHWRSRRPEPPERAVAAAAPPEGEVPKPVALVAGRVGKRECQESEDEQEAWVRFLVAPGVPGGELPLGRLLAPRGSRGCSPRPRRRNRRAAARS